jgi:lipoprotein NlpD
MFYPKHLNSSHGTQARNVLTATAVVFLLTACLGRGYQAPVADRGERQVVTAPIIVDSGNPNLASLRATSNRISVSSSTGSRRSSSSITRSVEANSGQIHRVKPGDTLYSIAFQYDLDFRRLAIANSLRTPYTIFVGQEINLDVSRISNAQIAQPTYTAGTEVSNNGIARAQASRARSGGVLRQPISGTQTLKPVLQWPLQGRILQGFGAASNKGIDIAANLGDDVLAAGDGVYSGGGVQGSGNLIIIRHSDRYLSAYAHNSAMLVAAGSRVRGGQKIAEVGQNSSGTTLLHFEIRLDGKSVDPQSYLP